MEFQRIHAGLERVVAQLQLGLFLAAHIQIRGRFQRGLQIYKTGTLLSGRIGHAAVHLVRHDLGGGHRQAVDENAAVRRAHGGIELLHILRQHGCHARHIGRGHGCAAHVAVAVVERQRRIDAATGRGDLRLQLQPGQRPPGAEIAHGQEALAGGVQRQGLVLQRGEHFAVGEGDGRRRDAAVLNRHIQQIPVLVVVDQAADRAGRGGVFLLVLKGQRAAADHGDLAGHVQLREVLRRAGARHHHEGEFRALLPVQQLRREIMVLNILIGDGVPAGGEGRLRTRVDAGDG